MKFVDLFAGLGGFNAALRHLGHECVFASEIDNGLRDLYAENFPEIDGRIFGDIRVCRDDVPPHDILCAGFPCQPFSKSGFQLGLHDKIKGTLFDEIVYILEKRRPKYVFMENVGNFERHDKGRTWQIVREKLEALQYEVRGTEHVTSGGSGLLSPQHFGYPHSRERFFIIAIQGELPANPFPKGSRKCKTDLKSIVQSPDELTEHDRKETRLTRTQIECIDHWNLLLARLPEEAPLPSFPIWGDEIDATYPYVDYTPFSAPTDELARCLNGHETEITWTHEELLRLLPRYCPFAEIFIGFLNYDSQSNHSVPDTG